MTSIELPRVTPAHRKPLSGWAVLAMLLGFFGTVLTANGIMIHYAIKTFPGVQDDKAYERGLHYNDQIAAAAQQSSLGWRAEGRVVRGLDGKSDLIVTIADPAGAAVTGLAITGKLEFMPDGRRDLALALNESRPGEYRTEIKATPGAWLLDISAARQGELLYRSRNRLTIR